MKSTPVFQRSYVNWPLVTAATLGGSVLAIACKAAWGFQDRKGEWVIPPRFCEVDDFSEGLAAASIEVPFPR